MAIFLFSQGDLSNETKKEISKNLKPKKQHSLYLTRDEMPFKIRILDYLMSDNTLDGLLNVYNKFTELKEKRIQGKMSSEEIQFKERIAQNIYPFGYGDIIAGEVISKDIGGDKSGILGKLKSIQENKKMLSKENLEKDKKIKEMKKIRVDLFRKYLGLPQYYDTIRLSDFKPSQSKDKNAVYFCFDSNKIIKSIKENIIKLKNSFSLDDELDYKIKLTKGSLKEKEIEKIKNFNDLELYVQTYKTLVLNKYTAHLGKYKASTGFDEKKQEKYISYYDIWDLDPPSLKKVGIDIDQFNFPFEIYGRIYESDFNKNIK